MTPQEMYIKRCEILVNFKHSSTVTIRETLEQLDALDTGSQSKTEDAFYAFVRDHDRQYQALLQSQGTSSQQAVIDTMIASLMAYAETLEKGGKE